MNGENFAADFFSLPEYYVDIVRTEALGTEHIRAYHWANRGGVLCPLFTTILSTAKLVGIGQEVRDHAIQAIRARASH